MADGSWKKENLLLGEKSVLMLRRERRIGIRSQEAVTTAMGSVCVVIDGDVGSFRDGTVIAAVFVEFRSFGMPASPRSIESNTIVGDRSSNSAFIALSKALFVI